MWHSLWRLSHVLTTRNFVPFIHFTLEIRHSILSQKNDYPAHGKFTHHLLSHMQRKSVWRAAPQHRQGWLVVGSRLEVAVFGNASAVCEMPNAECKQQQSVVGLICTISRVCIRFSGRPLSNFYSASKIGFDANIFFITPHILCCDKQQSIGLVQKTSPYKCSKPNVEWNLRHKHKISPQNLS